MRHASFNSSGFDLGIYDQVTWNSLHGRFFFYTTTGQPLLHLSNHVSPIILLVAPFYLIYDSPVTLLLLQPVSIGLGGLPLFWLAREKLNSGFVAITLLLAYLLFPTLEIVTLWDFHPPVLSVGFFMFAFYFLVKQRSGWFFLCAMLAMAGKEQLPLQVAFLGLYAIIWYRNWRLGLLTIGVAMAWFFIIMYWIIPANSVTGDHLFIGYYADLGSSPLEIVVTAITRPDLIIKNLWQPAKLRYMYDILTPFAYLPLFGLPVLLIGLPSFAINLLSGNTAMHDATGGQYGADVAPWLAWGALYGLIYLRQGLNWLWPTIQPRLMTAATLLLLSIATVWHIFYGFSPLSFNPPHKKWVVTKHDRLASRFMEQIPPDASLSSQSKLYPHLSHRLIAYQLPDVNEADYVFADITTATWPIHPNDLLAQLNELLNSGQFGVLDAADGYLLLQRGLDNSTIPDSFYDFARISEATPQYPLKLQFGDELRLLGFDLTDDPRREETSVRLYWQALRPIDRNLRLYPFFINDNGQVVEDTEQRPLLTQLWYPPHLWKEGEIVVTETMFWRLGDRWSVAVGVLSGSNWADWEQRLKVQNIDSTETVRLFETNSWARLAAFERQGRELHNIASSNRKLQPTRPLQANLDAQIELQGYDLSKSKQELTVTLHWQALTTIPKDYTIFIHLVNSEGQTVAQQDGVPWWELPIPTSTWLPGEKLRDRHTLSLPPDLPPGEYSLWVGMYYWETLERLPVVENGLPVNDYIDLGAVTIGQ